MKPLRRFVRNEQGSVTVEFAIVTPILGLLLAGVLSFGWLFAVSSSLQRLAAEAARASLMGTTQSERMTLAQSAITSWAASYPFLKASRISSQVVAVSQPMTGVRVTLTYDVRDSYVQKLTKLWGDGAQTVTRGAYAAW